jgi:hypothetical protein
MNKLNIGTIVTPKSHLIRPGIKRDYYLILEKGEQNHDWSIGVIHTNKQFLCNSHLIPEDINDFIEVSLFKSYLINKEICLFEFFYEQPVYAKVTDFYGDDKEIKFIKDQSNFIGDAFYGLEYADKRLEGYIYFNMSKE